MYNNEATAHGKLSLKSLLICWLIILGGYLLIRMVFLVFGLQLHLAAQGACLVLLPFIFGALYLRKCCKKQKPWFYLLGLLLPAVAEKLTLYFLGAYMCGVSPFSVTEVMEQSEGSNRIRYSLHGCPCGTQSTCCSLTGYIFFAEQPLPLPVHLACRLYKNEWPTEYGAVFLSESPAGS